MNFWISSKQLPKFDLQVTVITVWKVESKKMCASICFHLVAHDMALNNFNYIAAY